MSKILIGVVVIYVCQWWSNIKKKSS